MGNRLALYAITGSHACLVAELMIEHKRLAYPGRIPALLPAAWLSPAATATPPREDARVV